MVSPGAAVGVANPAVQQGVIDFIDGLFVPGPPTSGMSAAAQAASFGMKGVFSPDDEEREGYEVE
ncbi:hypothetical protein GCM10017767_16790 [Halomonas urumqiensis]|nr:hypothetical protein GCM10017767_16790 [Halomonas urumqiensis]